MARSDRIEFYEANQPYYEFTNFYLAPFELDGHMWPTSEHYFQAQKFTDPDLQALVRSQRTPLGAFQLVRYPQYASRVRADWMQVRDDAMYRAVRAKFTQNPRLRDLLLGTRDLPIFEHTNQDRYWGDGGNGTGVNMLGQILMRVREELRVASSRVAPAIATSPPLISPPPMSFLDTLAADPNFQRKLASIRAANFVPEEDVDMTASSSWLPSEAPSRPLPSPPSPSGTIVPVYQVSGSLVADITPFLQAHINPAFRLQAAGAPSSTTAGGPAAILALYTSGTRFLDELHSLQAQKFGARFGRTVAVVMTMIPNPAETTAAMVGSLAMAGLIQLDNNWRAIDNAFNQQTCDRISQALQAPPPPPPRAPSPSIIPPPPPPRSSLSSSPSSLEQENAQLRQLIQQLQVKFITDLESYQKTSDQTLSQYRNMMSRIRQASITV